MVVMAVVLAAATFLESAKGREYVQWHVYKSPWFMALLGLLALNILAATIVRFPWRRGHRRVSPGPCRGVGALGRRDAHVHGRRRGPTRPGRRPGGDAILMTDSSQLTTAWSRHENHAACSTSSRTDRLARGQDRWTWVDRRRATGGAEVLPPCPHRRTVGRGFLRRQRPGCPNGAGRPRRHADGPTVARGRSVCRRDVPRSRKAGVSACLGGLDAGRFRPFTRRRQGHRRNPVDALRWPDVPDSCAREHRKKGFFRQERHPRGDRRLLA